MSDWTDADVARLKELHAEGLTNSEIANEMGRTRNAICGKVDRLGLAKPDEAERRALASKRAAAARRRQNGYRAHAPVPAALSAAVPVLSFEPKNPVSLMDIGYAQCRWVVSEDVIPALMCGEPTPGGSWCQHHLRIVAAPPRPR